MLRAHNKDSDQAGANVQADRSLRWGHVILIVLSCCGSNIIVLTVRKNNKGRAISINHRLPMAIHETAGVFSALRQNCQQPMVIQIYDKEGKNDYILNIQNNRI